MGTMRPMNLARALNYAIPLDGSVPEWVQILPPGPEVVGEDSRGWWSPCVHAASGRVECTAAIVPLGVAKGIMFWQGNTVSLPKRNGVGTGSK